VEKKLSFSSDKLQEIIKRYPTPFHLYDEKAIRENARKLLRAFSWNAGFKEYFAVKANPNPYIMKILRSEGFGSDCSSLPELILSEKVGIIGEEIMFSSNDTPAIEYNKAIELCAIVNLDDITHISYLEKHCGMPEVISFRYNPGPLRKGNAIIGHPEESKYGFTKQQLFEGYRAVREKGAKRFGLHTFVASNELDPQFFIDTAIMLFELAIELKNQLGIRLEFLNLSGGIGIPYKPEDKAIDLEYIGSGIQNMYEKMLVPAGLHPMKLFMECGRVITGPYGYLISRVLHKKEIYRDFIGLDACMTNLMRPALYGAYHHITVLGKETLPGDHVYDVTGSLCENNDKFAINRKLPKIEIGDIIIIHDSGAHGHAMGFNYNGKLRSAELLLRENGEGVQIRRAETTEDYFRTLDFSGLDSFTV
jgi:diaminopimelate decarboxylase